MTATLAAFAVILFFAFCVEATAGFGSMLVAVTLGAHLMPVDQIVPIAVPLNVALTGYLVARHHQQIAWRLLLTTVLPLMGLGLGVGQLLFYSLGRAGLQSLLGVIVVLAAWRELMKALGRGDSSAVALHPVARTVWLFGAGVIQGLYATGGPPLVYVIGRLGFDKRVFRSTMVTVWLVLNSALTLSFAATGTIGGAELTRIGTLLPVVVLGIVFGERLHDRVDEQRFRIVIFSLLLVAGVLLVLPLH